MKTLKLKGGKISLMLFLGILLSSLLPLKANVLTYENPSDVDGGGYAWEFNDGNVLYFNRGEFLKVLSPNLTPLSNVPIINWDWSFLNEIIVDETDNSFFSALRSGDLVTLTQYNSTGAVAQSNVYSFPITSMNGSIDHSHSISTIDDDRIILFYSTYESGITETAWKIIDKSTGNTLNDAIYNWNNTPARVRQICYYNNALFIVYQNWSNPFDSYLAKFDLNGNFISEVNLTTQLNLEAYFYPSFEVLSNGNLKFYRGSTSEFLEISTDANIISTTPVILQSGLMNYDFMNDSLYAWIKVLGDEVLAGTGNYLTGNVVNQHVIYTNLGVNYNLFEYNFLNSSTNNSVLATFDYYGNNNQNVLIKIDTVTQVEGSFCIEFDEQPNAYSTIYNESEYAEGDVFYSEDGIGFSIFYGDDTNPFILGSNYNDTSTINFVDAMAELDLSPISYLNKKITIEDLFYGDVLIIINETDTVFQQYNTYIANTGSGVSYEHIGTAPFQDSGVITLQGPIQQLKIGGFEYEIDRICIEPYINESFCIEFDEQPNVNSITYNESEYAEGDVFYNEDGIGFSIFYGDVTNPFILGSNNNTSTINFVDAMTELDLSPLSYLNKKITIEDLFYGDVLIIINETDTIFQQYNTYISNTGSGVSYEHVGTAQFQDSGTITLQGPIQQLKIGGFEYAVDRICIEPLASDSVWPGDADANSIANVFDVFPVGIGYGSAGPVRTNATTNWVGQEATNWGNDFSFGVNYKHADCDGNGVINVLDGLPILQNYGLTHNKGEEVVDAEETDPILFFETDVDTTYTSTALSIPIHLGSMDVPADEVYGVAFTIHFDPSLVDTGNFEVTFNNSWLGTIDTDMMAIQKLFASEGQLHVGMVRTNQQMVNNYGEIATLEIITSDDLIGKTEAVAYLNLTFTDVKVVTIENLELPVNLEEREIVLIDEETASVKPLNTLNNVTIYPQPTSGLLFIKSTETITQASVLDITGKEIIQTNGDQIYSVDVVSLASGTYFIKLTSKNGQITTKKFIKK